MANTKAIEALRQMNPQAVAKYEAQQIMAAQRRARKQKRDRRAEPIVSARTPMRAFLPPKATLDDMFKASREVLKREGEKLGKEPQHEPSTRSEQRRRKRQSKGAIAR